MLAAAAAAAASCALVMACWRACCSPSGPKGTCCPAGRCKIRGGPGGGVGDIVVVIVTKMGEVSANLFDDAADKLLYAMLLRR